MDFIMAGTTEELLNKLVDLVQNAFSLPFGADRCLVDRDKVLGLIDEIKSVMPREIEQACNIVEKSNDITGEAKREAAAIKRKAEERALTLINENKIVQEARNKAHDIMESAKTRDRELRKAINEYADATFKRLEDTSGKVFAELQKTQTELRKARQEFVKAAKES